MKKPSILILFIFVLLSGVFSNASTFISHGESLWMLGEDGKIYTRGLQSKWEKFEYQLPENIKSKSINLIDVLVSENWNGFGFDREIKPMLQVVGGNGIIYGLILGISSGFEEHPKQLPGDVKPLVTN